MINSWFLGFFCREDVESFSFYISGHTKSWEAGQPGLLTQCEDFEGKPIDLYGPIDPTEQTTYDFLAGFFDEITRVFPEKYIHIGGDEVVEDSCW